MTADPPAVEPISDFGAFVDELVRRHVEACDQQPHPDELIGCIDTIGNGLDVRFKALIDARARLQAAEEQWFPLSEEIEALRKDLQAEIDAREAAEARATKADGTWRCFHCGEVFTDEGQARKHFGTWDGEDTWPAACVDPMRTDEKLRREFIVETQRELDAEREASHAQRMRADAAEARAARAEVKGFNEGIEAAAKWAAERASWANDPHFVRCEIVARRYMVDATAIRALTRSAPATEQEEKGNG